MNPLMMVALDVATLALLGMAVIALINSRTFPRLTPRTPPAAPTVSLLVPARNEAAVIGRTVRLLLAQEYAHFDVWVLDDHSDDDTGTLARTAAAGDARLHVLSGRSLPPGWLGKNWACWQLTQAAPGEVLVFTDADVQWQPGALAALVADMVEAQADLLTVWPTQRTVTWGERLVVPLMALVVQAYLPLPLVHHTANRSLAAANGQCMAFRRDAYTAIDGHRHVRANVLEDVTMARHLKGQGLRLRMADGGGLIECRMYGSWSQVRDGYAKNILAGYGDSVVGLALATLFHWLVFLLPWAALVAGFRGAPVPGWPHWPLTLILVGLALRAWTAAFTGQRVVDALLMPISVLLMTRIAAQALWWRWRYGGPRWKGRIVRRSV